MFPVARKKLDLMGSREVGNRLGGVSVQRVHQLAQEYEDFPEPVAELSAGKVWLAEDVEAWAARHPERRPGRPKAAPPEER